MGILIIFTIIIYAVVGVRLIGDNLVSFDEYESNFKDLGHTSNILFVLMTLNNYPHAV